MARVLAISSQVVRGHVGLSAIVPALQRLGHEVWALPSIILSNHPGHPHAAGLPIAAAALEQMVDALDRNGWLGEIDAVHTGYLPTAEHVQLAAAIVRRLKGQHSIVYLCDPVLGDEPKGLYLDPRAANAIRDDLAQLADVLTPNRFELGWLAGGPTGTVGELKRTAQALTGGTVLVTSAIRHGPVLKNILFASGEALECEIPWRKDVPHGTGDFFAALYLGHRLNGEAEADALARATARIEQVILASEGRDELTAVASEEAWSRVIHLETRRLA